MVPRRRGPTGKPCLALFMLFAMLYFAVPEHIDICRDCSCFGTLQHVSCEGVFRVGAQLKHTFEDVAFRGFDIDVPHSKLSPDLFWNRTGIIFLDLEENGFKFIDDRLFTILRQVKSLTLSFNALTAIPVFHNLTSLQDLYLGFNNIRSIGSNLKAHAPKLKKLILDHNRITFVQGDQFPDELEKLGLSFNRITSIDRGSLSGLLQLKKVDLTGNLISQISSGSFLLPGLKIVILNKNRIREIFKDAFHPELDKIYFDNNRLSELGNISGIPSLKGLWVSYQSEVIKLQEIPLLENLTQLTITVETSPDHADWIDRILTQMPRLQVLSVVEGKMDYVPMKSHEHLRVVNFNSCSIKDIHNLTLLSMLSSLSANNNLMTSISRISGLSNLVHVDLNQNLIVTISASDLANLPRLETINFSGNEITFITGRFDVQNLQSINLSMNKIHSISTRAFSDLRRINDIIISYNPLRNTNQIEFIRPLTHLMLRYAKLTRVDSDSFRGLQSMCLVDLTSNLISEIFGISYLPSLNTLILDNNPLNFISPNLLQSLPHLFTLSLKNTHLLAFPIVHGVFPQMDTIILSGNYLKQIPRQISHNFPNLRSLQLSNNSIDRFELDTFAMFNNLIHFSMDGNRISYYDTNTTENISLQNLSIGSRHTDFMSNGMHDVLKKMYNFAVYGSSLLNVSGRFLCGHHAQFVLVNGGMIQDVADTCPPLSLNTLHAFELENVVISTSSFYTLLTQTAVGAYFINISILKEYNDNRSKLYHTQLRHLRYQESGLVELLQVFAPAMISLDVSGNLLEELKLRDLTKLYPRLHTLDLSNNRIRVLSSCYVSGVSHPLKVLILKGNHLGLFSAWRCGNGYKILTNLLTLNLDDNRLSYLEREIIPRSSSDQAPFRTSVSAGDNRLICDCQQRWLVKVEDSISFVNTKCSAPEGHAGKHLSDLLKDGFPCPLSVSEEQACTISNNSDVLVQCPAASYPFPEISWVPAESGVDFNETLSVDHPMEDLEIVAGSLWVKFDSRRLYVDEGEMNISLTCRAISEGVTLDINVLVHIEFINVDETGEYSNLSVQCYPSVTDSGRKLVQPISASTEDIGTTENLTGWALGDAKSCLQSGDGTLIAVMVGITCFVHYVLT